MKALISFSPSNFETRRFQAMVKLAPPHLGDLLLGVAAATGVDALGVPAGVPAAGMDALGVPAVGAAAS